MKVIIVEKDGQVARRVIRILSTIDKGIQIPAVVADVGALSGHLSGSNLPDLVLVNKDTIGETNYLVEAKLLITAGTTHLTYHAFRLTHLKYLHKDFAPAFALDSLVQPGKAVTTKVALRTALSPVFRKRFLVSHKQKFITVNVDAIAYFFSEQRFIFFKTFDNRKFLIEYRMEELERMLDPELFFRINRSYFISIKSIAFIQPFPGNRLKMVLSPEAEKEIIVSRERLAAFKIWLGE